MLHPVIPLILFALVATSTPGIATTLSTASGAQFGFRRSIPLVVGSAAGLATVTGAAAAGLAGLLLAMPSLQLAMKIAGSLYLVWLALKIGRAGAPKFDLTMVKPNSFLGGAGIQWMNPKGWAMGLGAAASFAALADGPARLALLLGSTFGLTAAFSLSLWCVAGMLLARLLKTERQWRALNILLGLVLAASIIPMWRQA
ncbi:MULTISPECIES: LysE family translocator [unclassified Mesorhizobium]|uniref:LysE family translocator n=1 Tax=unclassified Mesorhizobium TaxID=325217 RepID=UPI00112C7C5C|nr:MULTISPECIES: LysE family translocator [unclassified Mesorhizobium]MBZ9810193.1 LysE family translocator [Mesorhizobium sp. ESP-6-2]MBZ9944141.1 LysE family translocator [Mesorhizobium sp. BR1-1-13]TPM29490.1 LysE family translocator [Mesorhizobium sp. B2-2-2]